MTISADISRLLDDNALEEAINVAKAYVKGTPSDHKGRNLYIDVLILAGEYEKADAQCSLAATFSPEDSMGYSVLRQNLRAMSAREAWYLSAAVPDFPGGPSELDQLAIKAALALKDNDISLAADSLAALEERRGQVPLSVNGKTVDDIRDLDDCIPHALEVLTSGGRYLWIDYRRIQSLSIAPMARPRDIAFRQADLVLLDGAVANVLVPAVYHSDKADASLRLGRETEWDERNPAFVTGAGQRCLLAGDDMIAFHEISELTATDVAGDRQIAHG